MVSLKTFGLVSSLLLTASTALAADLPAPMDPLPEMPVIAPVDIGGEWYLRGDIGVSSYETSRWRQTPSNNGSTILQTGFVTDSLSGGGFAGAGVGYQFNEWLRADVTAEYRTAVSASGTYQEITQFTPAGASTPVTFAGQNNYRGDLSSLALLFNGYIDLGTWYGVTPYIGAGVGVTRNRTSGFTDNGYALIGAPNGPLFPVATNVIGSGNKTNLAWALQAGLGYEVTPGLKLEIGYRYINLGDAKTGGVYCGALVNACAATVAPGVRIKDIEAHEIKVGMRWMLGGAPAPLPQPIAIAEPLVRKY